MSKNQSRKSISVSGEVYSAMKARCDKDGGTMSGLAEELIRAFLGMPARGFWSEPAKEKPKKKSRPKAERPRVPLKVDRTAMIKSAVDRFHGRQKETPELMAQAADKIFTF